MSLTAARGPFGEDPAGCFNFEPQAPTDAVLYWDPVPYRLRAFIADELVFDTTEAKLLHETGHLPVYYIPKDDLRDALLEPSDTWTSCVHKGDASYWTIRVHDRVEEDAAWAYENPLEQAAFLVGHLAFQWDRLDEWFVEDEQVYGHPRDPYHRIDVYRTTRHVRFSLDGQELAESIRARVLFETGLPPRWYLPTEDVRLELLEPSPTRSRCAYKGSASYWHVLIGDELHEDLAWSYPDPDDDGRDVRGLICFLQERCLLELDNVEQAHPVTQWSR